MGNNNIWLIDHKATLSEYSPMNLDGSAWILGICVLSAPDESSAMSKFKEFLKSEEMELIEVYDMREYQAADFSDDSRRTNQVNNAVRMVSQDGEPCYVYARTSEAMNEDGGSTDE